MVAGDTTFASPSDLMVITGVLDRLSSRELSGNRAKEAVHHLLRSLVEHDQEIFVNILKKDLRCGISVVTINDAIPELIQDFGIMKAKTYEVKRFIKGMYMSLKMEGNRAPMKERVLYSRNGIPLQGFEHIMDVMPPWLTDTDGEMLDPLKVWQKSSGDVRSHAPSPGQVYHIFDLPAHPGTFEERLAQMNEFQSALSPDIPIKFVKHVRVWSLEKVEQQFQKALDFGYEGLVLKSINHYYKTRRSYDWLKVKNTREEDLPIINVFEGTGRNEGSLGGIIVQRKNGKTVRVGTGFSDGLRHAIWNDVDGYIGKTAEVLYHEETPDGSLRHPRLGKGGIRWDK